MARLEKMLRCETCKERGDEQPVTFLKMTVFESVVTPWGKYPRGRPSSKKTVSYICPICEDLVRQYNGKHG